MTEDQMRARISELEGALGLVPQLAEIMKKSIRAKDGPHAIVTPDGQRIEGIAADCVIQLSELVEEIAERARAVLSIGGCSGSQARSSAAAPGLHPAVLNEPSAPRLCDRVAPYVADYEYRGDEGDYTPNDKERVLIEDAIHGFISDNEGDI